MMAKPVIIDFVPHAGGILGLLLAAGSPGLDIRAVAVTTNRAEAEKDTALTLSLLGLLKSPVPLGVGASAPVIALPQAAEFARGARFPGILNIPAPTAAADTIHAWDLVLQEASKAPGEVELITLGPLTNTAIALLRYPELAKKLKRITIAGGSAHTGNASAYGEYSFAADPYAADAVFKSGVPITMIGLDGLVNGAFTKEELASFVGRLSAVTEGIPALFRTVLTASLADGLQGPDLHNLITIASVINPGIGSLSPYYIEIETRSSISVGQTVTDLHYRIGKEPNADILLDLNREGFLSVLGNVLAG
ncbi:pyrimidine-specific ribonucleoside hydrolase RihA [Spirochaetia bacterium]|nr:pyrimidine-specific ribonucleoside hydrolase RihA [Spirochaetia bacterium]